MEDLLWITFVPYYCKHFLINMSVMFRIEASRSFFPHLFPRVKVEFYQMAIKKENCFIQFHPSYKSAFTRTRSQQRLALD